jgi:hypothetical protein
MERPRKISRWLELIGKALKEKSAREEAHRRRSTRGFRHDKEQNIDDPPLGDDHIDQAGIGAFAK